MEFLGIPNNSYEYEFLGIARQAAEGSRSWESAGRPCGVNPAHAPAEEGRGAGSEAWAHHSFTNPHPSTFHPPPLKTNRMPTQTHTRRAPQKHTRNAQKSP